MHLQPEGDDIGAYVYLLKDCWSPEFVDSVFSCIDLVPFLDGTCIGNAGEYKERHYRCVSSDTRDVFKLGSDRKFLACTHMSDIEVHLAMAINRLFQQEDGLVAQHARDKAFLCSARGRMLNQTTAATVISSSYGLHSDASMHHNHEERLPTSFDERECTSSGLGFNEKIFLLPSCRLVRVGTAVFSTCPHDSATITWYKHDPSDKDG